MFAVTSASKLENHMKVQHAAFKSWKNIGLSILCVVHPNDLKQMQDEYPEVDEWKTTEDMATDYPWPTPKISAIIKAGKDTGDRFMLINSDIEIHGDQDILTKAMAFNGVTVGIRHNFNRKWYQSEREVFGFDAFVMSREVANEIPDMPFGIGKPMWDYWLPIHFQSKGISMEFIGKPFFFHKKHQIHWDLKQWMMGLNWVRGKYETDLTAENSTEWRRRLPFGPPALHS